MILIHNVDPEEVFNDVSNIVELYHKWDTQLESCYSRPNALTEMIALSHDILQNPSFIYAPDGKNLAIAPEFPPSIHWHWEEILVNQGLTEERMELLQDSINLTNVFLDRKPTTRDSHLGSHQYMHCSLVANGYMAGHFVLFSMLRPFESGLEHLVTNLINHMNTYMSQHLDIYSPTSRVGELIDALVHNKPYSEKDFLLFQKLLRWNGQKDSYRFYILKEIVKGEPVHPSRTCNKITERFRSCISYLESNLLVILFDLNHSEQEGEDVASFINTLEINFYIGISCPFRGIKNAQRYYYQALSEMVRCKENDLPYSYAEDHISDHIKEYLLRDPANETYVNRSVIYLKEYDFREKTHYYEDSVRIMV